MSITFHREPLRLQGLSPSEHVPAQNDRRLVERSKSGDAEAFARLYDRYAERVFGYMYFQMQEEQTAEDLTARVFMKAWKNIGCYEPDKPPFSIWLYMIARQAVIDFRQNQDGTSSIMEILSPADKGLEEYEPFRPCNQE